MGLVVLTGVALFAFRDNRSTYRTERDKLTIETRITSYNVCYTKLLRLLWQKQPQTVKEINECINQERPTGYTTTLKIMQIMTQKRYVRRVTEGKKHLYYAELQQDDTQRVLIDKLLDGAFMGSAQRLIRNNFV